jgi:hypothetical protein
MKNREAQAMFQESKLLYRERRYEDALAILKQLDAQYPHTRNILYPIVKCFRRLGRFDEAAAVCDRLILEFEDERAKHVRANIQRALDRAGAKTIAVASDMQYNLDDDLDAGFDDLNLGDLPPLDEEAPTVQLPGGYGAKGTAGPRIQQQGREIPWIPIGVGVIAILILIGVFAALSGGGSGEDESGIEAESGQTPAN